MSDHVDYWRAELRAALDQMGVDYSLTARYNADDVLVTNGDWGREERAHLINALQVRGFTVTSSTSDAHIHVDAPDDRLEHDFTEAGQ